MSGAYFRQPHTQPDEDDRIAPPLPPTHPSIHRNSSSVDRTRLVMAYDQARQHAYQAPTNPRYSSLNAAARPDFHTSSSTRSIPSYNSYEPRRSIPEMSEPQPAVPQWQPDEDVSKCPVCNQDFFIFFRKHHCRKCGRVVCGDCSRHRITLPHRYIVQPPWGPDSASSSSHNGESVRVCNPCVPDPWTPASSARSHSSPSDHEPRSPISHRYSMPVSPSASQPDAILNHLHYPSQHSSRHSVDLPQHSRRSSGQFFTSPLAPFYQPQNISSPPYRHPHRNSSAAPEFSPRRDRSLPQRPVQASNATSTPQPIHYVPQPPRRVVKEEDECPVCGIELAPGEEFREQHITSCITTRFGSLDPSRGTPVSPTGPSAAQPGSSLNTPPSSRARAQSYRSRGLYPYKATEKDCTDNEGQEQECPICFEEFQPGDALGRLECLCRFHHSCIREWWVRKGPGMCPVHASHE